MIIVIANSKKWFNTENLKKKLKGHKVVEITNKKKLNPTFLKKLNCKIIFFIHWHYLVPSKILKQFKCILFHTAPLPYGRGGSPIQNLILKGYKNVPVCALEMVEELDAGPILIKKYINLKGNLSQILSRVETTITYLVQIILYKKISPKAQLGKVVKFKRLKESENEIPSNLSLDKFYDRIRMLDDPNYPSAFIKYGNKILYLKNAVYKKGKLLCEIEIKDQN
ncbi:MAG: hypothetical protein CBB97_09590 [Candidatus Endolissoclinum sp. TMED37]|nr:MAG: hypothetical protein CBB97_09590 [Candidatus Endolissoclinum sp. TMED37]